MFTDNVFYHKWNDNKKNYHLLDYLLPSEDLEDLNTIQQNANSIENYDFTNLIKKESLEVKTEIMEHLWKIIISDQSIDQYESSLMRRICGLIYFPDKLSGDIKLKILNTK